MKLPATIGVLGICALAILTPASAQPRPAAQPLDLRTNTDYPLQGQPVTLTSHWEGLKPAWRGRYQLRYQVSRTNPPTWIDMPGYTCTTAPCQYAIASPAAAEFKGRPQIVILFRAVIRDTTTGRDAPAQMVKTVTWIVDPSQQTQTTSTGPYSLSLTVNGLGCTITPKPKVDTYANANCRARGPLDVHQANVPVVNIGPNGKGRFTSAAFAVVATWSPLPPGVWSVRITHGNFSISCPTSPCTLQVPNQTLDGELIGRANAVASLTWKEGTRANPSTEGWQTSLGAEIGIDFMRR